MITKHRADELADKLPKVVKAEYYESGGDIWADITDEAFKAINEAFTMLRQQQAEIEALKEIIAISDRNHNAWNKAKELLK